MDIEKLAEDHRRKTWTGSAASRVTELTNEQLKRIETDPMFMKYERNPEGNHTYTEGSIESAARHELAWRNENGLHFGWTCKR